MSQETNPSLVARETLRQLVIHKFPPTPDNYHRMYEKIAGAPSSRIDPGTMKLLSELAKEFPRNTPELVSFANILEQAANDKNWLKYKTALVSLANTAALSTGTQKKQDYVLPENEVAWGKTIATLLQQLEHNHGALTTAKKRESLNRVLAKFVESPAQLHAKLQALVDSWMALASATKIKAPDSSLSPEKVNNAAAEISSSAQAISLPENTVSGVPNQLLELLAQLLEHIVTTQLGDNVLTNEAKLLVKQVRTINNQQELAQFIAHFKQFGDRLESHSGDGARLQRGLLRIINLLMDRTGKLLSDDQWSQSQIALLQETLASQLDLQVIEQAENQLTKIMQKQDIIRCSLDEAKTTLKRMVTCLVGNIETLSDSTDEYHDKIEHYSVKMNQTEDITELNQLLVDIMSETKKVQTRVQNSRDEFLAARAEVDAAQSKIQQLESNLVQMEEKVLEDHLTGILNRRGLDNAFARESSRAQRQQKPMSLAILDIDNFKQLNDTYGHKVGDDALVYLVEAIQETIRPEDIVARFGGEEFIVLLPDANVEQAVSAVNRVRRSLTKRLFLHKKSRLLITFSAGVAECQSGESQESVIVRADAALYCAKKNGKNQVIAA